MTAIEKNLAAYETDVDFPMSAAWSICRCL